MSGQDRWRGLSTNRRPLFRDRGANPSGGHHQSSKTINTWREKRTSTEATRPQFGRILFTLTLDRVDKLCSTFEPDPPTQITHCEDIASFNWLNAEKPTILVPGKPPAWSPPITTPKLKEDSGDYFRDPNAARYPSYPIDPAVRAVFTSQPDFPTWSVDIFACGSTLGNILRFVRQGDKPFRFLVEQVGETVFFSRRENSPTETIPDIYGYGHTFPDAYTTWDHETKGSESHQRIIRYCFCGLDFLVRFEGDGYYKELVSKPRTSETVVQSSESDTVDHELALDFQNTSISSAQSARNEPLTVIRATHDVSIPRSAIFDLKTRSSRKKGTDILGDEMPRLWVRQVPHFVLAFHKHGVFDDIHSLDIRRETEKWERENTESLRKFAATLREIVSFVRARPDRKIEVTRTELGSLQFREQCTDANEILSEAVKNCWTGVSEDGRESVGY